MLKFLQLINVELVFEFVEDNRSTAVGETKARKVFLFEAEDLLIDFDSCLLNRDRTLEGSTIQCLEFHDKLIAISPSGFFVTKTDTLIGFLLDCEDLLVTVENESPDTAEALLVPESAPFPPSRSRPNSSQADCSRLIGSISLSVPDSSANCSPFLSFSRLTTGEVAFLFLETSDQLFII